MRYLIGTIQTFFFLFHFCLTLSLSFSQKSAVLSSTGCSFRHTQFFGLKWAVWFCMKSEEHLGACCLTLCASYSLKGCHPPSAPWLLEHMFEGVYFSMILCAVTSQAPFSKWEQSALDVSITWQPAAVLQIQGHAKLCFCGFSGLIIYTLEIIWPPCSLGTF